MKKYKPFIIGIAALVAFIVISSLISAPRYTFQRENLKKLESNDNFFRLIHVEYYRNILMPITLIKPVAKSLLLVAPSDLPSDIIGSTQRGKETVALRTIHLNYGQKPLLDYFKAYCNELLLDHNIVDDDGYHKIFRRAEKMSDEEYEIFCLSDYSKEIAYVEEQFSANAKEEFRKKTQDD